MDKQYLTTKDLAFRYGLTPSTIKSWRDKTKAGNKTGPTWYTLPKNHLRLGHSRVRYELHHVLAWEEAHNITPIHSF
jgi:transposase-like protein